jgi:preprotein translocase subunit Sec63
MPRALITLGGWILFALLAYYVSQQEVENKVYDPFEILGLRSVRFLLDYLPVRSSFQTRVQTKKRSDPIKKSYQSSTTRTRSS